MNKARRILHGRWQSEDVKWETGTTNLFVLKNYNYLIMLRRVHAQNNVPNLSVQRTSTSKPYLDRISQGSIFPATYKVSAVANWFKYMLAAQIGGINMQKKILILILIIIGSFSIFAQDENLRSPFLSIHSGVFITSMDNFNKTYDSRLGLVYGLGLG